MTPEIKRSGEAERTANPDPPRALSTAADCTSGARRAAAASQGSSGGAAAETGTSPSVGAAAASAKGGRHE